MHDQTSVGERTTPVVPQDVPAQQWLLRKSGVDAADAALRPIGHNSLTVVMAAHLAVDAVAPEVALLREVAHAAWHALDESGESDTEGLLYVSQRDWQRLADALDGAGWPAEFSEHEQVLFDSKPSAEEIVAALDRLLARFDLGAPKGHLGEPMSSADLRAVLRPQGPDGRGIE